MNARKLASLLVIALMLGGCSGGSDPEADPEATPPSEASADPTEAEPSDPSSEASAAPSETPTAAADEGPSPEEFLAEADAVCVRSAREFNALYNARGIPGTAKQVQALERAAVRVRENRLRGLRALEPPAEMATDFEAYVAARTASHTTLNQYLKASTAGKQKRAAALLKKSNRLDNRHQALARDLGLRACANRLAPAAQQEMRTAIVQFFTGPVAKTCRTLVAKAYLRYLGGKKACPDVLQRSEKVSVTNIEGIADVAGNADVKGTAYGKPVKVQLTYEGGTYKVLYFQYA